MSDLISRSELIKLINDKYIGLNDAEDLYHGGKFDCFNEIKLMIKNQPTAYDVDKVANAVVEITERISNNCDEIELDWPEEERTGYDMHEDILKIRHLVKHGCVGTNDVCEWKQTSTAKYKTGCGYKVEEYFDANACFCKQCGRKIKVVE